MSMKKINVALIGISGFGRVHLGTAEKLENENLINIKAICDTNYDALREVVDTLCQRGVRYYKDYQEMLEKEKDIDFVSVSTPIQLHKKMAIEVMEKGFNVLLEKPPAATIQEVEAIINASQRTGKICAVNFMLTSGKAFNVLMKKIEDGKLGKIINITGAGMWKRLDSYYTRTPWAGKLMLNNYYVLDGTINNPLAHLLNNMLYLSASAGANTVSAVTAELYHAHEIESEDTSCLKAEMDNGIILRYYATLCAEVDTTPYIIIQGSRGNALWNYENELTVELNGKVEKYKYDSENFVENMYRNLCTAISDIESKVYCSIEDTRNFILASNGAFESSKLIHKIPSKYINRYEMDDSIATDIRGINASIENAVKTGELFADTGVEWSVRGKRLDLSDYKEFKMFK